DPAHRETGNRAYLAVPVLRDQKWVASLVASDSAPRQWTEREVALLQAAAERAWLWVEHIRLLAALREKEAAELVQKGERRFRVLVDTVQDYAIYLLDPSGTILSWNAGAKRLNGYEADEVIGKNFALFYPDADRQSQRPLEVLARALSDGSY